jgi:hypothetical protein
MSIHRLKLAGTAVLVLRASRFFQAALFAIRCGSGGQIRERAKGSGRTHLRPEQSMGGH